VLFLVAIFFLKTTSIFKNTETYQNPNQENGLAYSSVTIKDLVSKDTDGDEIPDWEESLYGLDPTKKETTPGIPDNIAIEKLKSAQANTADTTKGTNSVTENLTKTDQFSRELFATIAAANQNGTMDQATIDALGASLAGKIQNPTVRKVFLISDIKIINDDSPQAIQKYEDALHSIYLKYPIKKGVVQVLQEFMTNKNNVEILTQLDPIINQLNKIVKDLVKINIPQSVSLLHLDLINSLQRIIENISDIKLFDSDTIVAFSALSQYQKNIDLGESAITKLRIKVTGN
jgi:hypothetical protein